MKICIVTVYNSINSGSFWQAFSLGKYLERKGHDVVYYKRNNKGSSASIRYKIQSIGSSFIHGGYREAMYYIKTLAEFKKMKKLFRIIDKNSINDIDCFVLGSDTIWNLNTKYFTNNRDVYFGGIFPKRKKIISYAASAANTSLELIKKYDDIQNSVTNINKISVRDIHTKDLLANITKNDIEIVCDPTLLLKKEEYEPFITQKINYKYIFVYLFEDLNENQIENIRVFAKRNNLKILSCTRNYSWCDEYLINTPNNFLNYIHESSYVITDTFHGTIFSINFNKKFISIDRGKNKVNELLGNCNLIDRLVNNNDISEQLENDIDYGEVNISVEKLRDKSVQFLEKINDI